MEISGVLEKQREYFYGNNTKPYENRLSALKSLKDSMLRHEEEILKALRDDLNKSKYEGYMTELGLCIQEVSYAIKHIKKWMKPVRKSVGVNALPGGAYEISEPYGIALIMSPWNYPFSLSILPLIGAVAAGNCVVIKPSEMASNVADIVEKIVEKAFLPEHVCVIKGDVDISEKLLEERFDYIFFTGNTVVGKHIMEKAAKNLTPVTLELGGKSPCIVLEDADLDESSKNIAFGKILNSGQTCVAPDYVLVDHKIRDAFCEKLAVQFKKMLPDGVEAESYPKMVNERHFDRVIDLLKDGTVYCGGRFSREKLKIEPTMLVDVSLDSKVMTDEIFGPILPIISYETLDCAEKFVKSREKPLALYIFASKKENAKRIIENISFGGGCVNDTISHITCKGLGFGGVGSSGMGAYHGKYSFDAFSHKKSIYKKSGLFEFKLRYAPYDKGIKKLKFLIK